MVSTQLKNISQNGNLPQIGLKIKNIWNHHPDDFQKFPVRGGSEVWIIHITRKYPSLRTLKNQVININKSTSRPDSNQGFPGFLLVFYKKSSWRLNQPVWKKTINLDHPQVGVFFSNHHFAMIMGILGKTTPMPRLPQANKTLVTVYEPWWSLNNPSIRPAGSVPFFFCMICLPWPPDLSTTPHCGLLFQLVTSSTVCQVRFNPKSGGTFFAELHPV